MKLATFDLNLLPVFEAVLRERSVTKAGEQLGLSQPAMSHALNRLRWLLKDQLFIRAPDGMLPTPRAEELARPVRRALGELQAALEPEQFVPAQADRHFTIAVNNYAAVVLAGPMMTNFASLAPKVRMSLRPSGTLDLRELLDRGDLDLVIASSHPTVERFASRLLLEDRYVAVLRRGHPATQARFDLKIFATMTHLSISSTGEDLRFVDAALGNHGLTRDVALEAPYLSAGAILIQSDMVAVLGYQIAREFQRAYPIELMDLPFESPALHSVMMWHRRFDDQPAHCWLRETLHFVATGLAT